MRILYHPRKLTRINNANVIYGLLYNWFAATDIRLIAPEGWHVPTKAEIETLQTELGGYTYGGGKLKETGTTYWNEPNTGATNEYGFNMRGSGYRSESGTYTGIKITSHFWSVTEYEFLTTASYYAGPVNYNAEYFGINASFKTIGHPVRLIKDDSTNTGTMTDNDGYVYVTVKIGSQVWTNANIKTTKYRNGDAITEVTNATDWASLSSGALCAYNNDWTNV